jgi:hypothetical protein
MPDNVMEVFIMTKAGPARPLQSNTVYWRKPEINTLDLIWIVGSENVSLESCKSVACLVFTAYAMVLQGDAVLQAISSLPVDLTKTEIPAAALVGVHDKSKLIDQKREAKIFVGYFGRGDS